MGLPGRSNIWKSNVLCHPDVGITLDLGSVLSLFSPSSICKEHKTLVMFSELSTKLLVDKTSFANDVILFLFLDNNCPSEGSLLFLLLL